jgi:hypothetical protein
LPARSFANIAYLAPGTEPVEPSDPTKARITAVSTGGSSGLNNELSVDGADDSDGALATLASEGLIPGVLSIAVPPNVPIPFRDYFGSSRFDTRSRNARAG